jgi:DNA-directed RNA polymerase specialized sigma24 family protein
MTKKNLQQLDLGQVIQECIQEHQRFHKGQLGEEGHCFELFRRAIEENDQDAWYAIHKQYYLTVAKWIGAHPRRDELIESAFTKLWRSLCDISLARRFPHVGAVLAYLRKCAVSVRLDLERRNRRQDRETPLNEAIVPHADDVRCKALENVESEAMRKQVRLWLDEHVEDEQERLVISMSYAFDLSPAEIARHCPEHFADARDVRRVKERVLKRLRRRTDELVGRIGQ